MKNFVFMLIMVWGCFALAAESGSPTDRRDYGAAYRGIRICDVLTIGAGWREPMNLYVRDATSRQLEIVKDAIRGWNYELNWMSGRELIRFATVTGTPAGAKDGTSVIDFSFTSSDTRLLGSTDVWGVDLENFEAYNNQHLGAQYHRGDVYEIKEADIKIYMNSVNQAYTSDDWSREDVLKNAILHELGHAIGLAHQHGASSVMNGNNALEYPGPLDQLALTCIYPFNMWGI